MGSPRARSRRAQVVNELRGDPILRSKYQFWMFMYPTGNPFLLSAADLRKALIEVRETVDPDRTDTAFDQTVLVGHSMGGILARMAVSESGDLLWANMSKQPFDQLVATAEERSMLARVLFFHPVPSVRRLIFIATPHRGSELGNQWIGRLVDSLIKLPSRISQTHDRLVEENPAGFFNRASGKDCHRVSTSSKSIIPCSRRFRRCRFRQG